MPLNLKDTISSQIVDILSATPRLYAENIALRLEKLRGEAVSLSALYKELKYLRDKGVVAKENRRFSLSLPWVISVAEYAATLEKRYVDEAFLKHYLPPPGERHRWRFRDLLTMEDFWNHLILTLFGVSTDAQLFGWSPRPWYALVHPAKERKLQDAISFVKKRMYMIFGGRGELDREAVKFKTQPVYTLGFGNSPFENERTKYINVIDDFVLTITLPEKLSRRIDQFFERSNKKFMQDDFRELMIIVTTPEQIVVELRNDSLRAKKLKRKFQSYFGLHA